MIRKTDFLVYGIFIQLLATQSILMFNVFDAIGYWEVKTLLHPIGVGLTIFYVVSLKKIKLSYSAIDILITVFFLLYFLLFLFNHKNTTSIFLTIRDTFLIFALIMIYNNSKIKLKTWRIFLKAALILTCLNIIAILATYIIGYEDYMKTATGRFVWGHDKEYNFKISFFYNLIRSPGLIGESANVGFFGLFTFWFFTKDVIFKKYSFLPLVLAILSLTRSVYLSLSIVVIIKLLNNKRALSFLSKHVWEVVFSIIPIVIVLWRYNIFEAESLFIRFKDWGEKLNFNLSYLIGGELGTIGSGVRGESNLETLDSYWITTFLSFGITGVILILFFIKSKMPKDVELSVFMFALALSGFFVTLTQSIVFLVMFPIIFLNIEKEDV